MSHAGFHQTQKQEQGLYLAPQLRQSLKILQVAAIDLRSTLIEELQTNPTLEELPSENHISLSEPESAYLSPSTQRNHQDQERKREHFFNSLVSETSLQEHLLEQAKLSDYPYPQILDALIGSLDERGFLPQSDAELEGITGVPWAEVQRAIECLQALEPAGIAARSLRESLLLQLEAKGWGDSLSARILKEQYDLLLRRRTAEMARALGTSIAEIERALERVASLDPAPGRRFEHTPNPAVEPDVIIRKREGRWHLQMTHCHIPQLRLSDTYKNLISEKQLATDETTSLLEKIKNARFLMNAIEQRQRTIERIARTLLGNQLDFFEKGPTALKPLTMSQVAQSLGLHETTISRAIASKYMDTPWGVLPFKYFFSSGYQTQEGESVSSTSIKELIARIIDKEPPEKPYSDQTLSERLWEEGRIKIARRTVTKYREELGILPTHLRRRFTPTP